ncbi:MAG TPA: four helix bundle protein [Chitinophagaceae bacterium]
METKKFLKLNDIGAFRISFHLSNYVWEIVLNWNGFSQRTIGEQFVRAVDSISSNIAEGFGRYGKKDKIKFYRYSQGSLSESLNWNEKSKVRRLLSGEDYKYIFSELQKLPKSINSLILFTNQKLKV